MYCSRSFSHTSHFCPSVSRRRRCIALMMWCMGDDVFSICHFTFCAQWGRGWKVQISVCWDNNNRLDTIVYLPFVYHPPCVCVFYTLGFFISLCWVCTLHVSVFCTDCSPVASCLQDDVDVEDDMTIREVRRTTDTCTNTHFSTK